MVTLAVDIKVKGTTTKQVLQILGEELVDCVWRGMNIIDFVIRNLNVIIKLFEKYFVEIGKYIFQIYRLQLMILQHSVHLEERLLGNTQLGVV